eukprot:scaffold79101_cov65-Phaeocystis_antarctica.AAC.8
MAWRRRHAVCTQHISHDPRRTAHLRTAADLPVSRSRSAANRPLAFAMAGRLGRAGRAGYSAGAGGWPRRQRRRRRRRLGLCCCSCCSYVGRRGSVSWR